jgi:hypothetical protein
MENRKVKERRGTRKIKKQGERGETRKDTGKERNKNGGGKIKRQREKQI